MPPALKKAWDILTVLIVVFVAILAILLVGIRLVGITPYTVLSGSMEPQYHVGSMIYVKAVDPTQLKERDPVTFYLDGDTVATHRIIEVIPDEYNENAVYFRTQGDANDSPDSNLLHSSKVIGKPVFSIPYLGYLSAYIQQSPGRNVALGVCALLLLCVMLPEIYKIFKLIGMMGKQKQAQNVHPPQKDDDTKQE